MVSTAVGALLVKAFPANAQPATKIYRIGTLSLASSNNTTLGTVLGQRLSARGYVLGKNISFIERSAEGNVGRLPLLAAELVELNVDIIVAGPVVAIRAAHAATTTIPIVMAFSGDDPVKSGFVTSLAHPGGNITGVTAQVRELAPKCMDVLRDAMPGIKRIAILTNPLRLEHADYLAMMRAGQPQGLQLQAVEARAADQYESAFAAMTKEHADAVIILGDVVFTRDSKQLAELAEAHRLPSIYIFRAFVAAGGMLSYGPDEAQLIELAAQYVDRILKGANPADLAVEQPTKFHLAINQKTANALGLTIPPSLLVRADEIVQ